VRRPYSVIQNWLQKPHGIHTVRDVQMDSGFVCPIRAFELNLILKTVFTLPDVERALWDWNRGDDGSQLNGIAHRSGGWAGSRCSF
jgi:hypothetical protein